jgi:hypothetical protein
MATQRGVRIGPEERNDEAHKRHQERQPDPSPSRNKLNDPRQSRGLSFVSPSEGPVQEPPKGGYASLDLS